MKRKWFLLSIPIVVVALLTQTYFASNSPPIQKIDITKKTVGFPIVFSVHEFLFKNNVWLVDSIDNAVPTTEDDTTDTIPMLDGSRIKRVHVTKSMFEWYQNITTLQNSLWYSRKDGYEQYEKFVSMPKPKNPQNNTVYYEVDGKFFDTKLALNQFLDAQVRLMNEQEIGNALQ